ncbi:copper homeostasis protein CutC [Cellulomonas sp.]|uniref:copper homeostasis protein CutC n=1 Tax=Cellulomonas sp. TaxID=40001 RepID=UPI003BA85CD0
MTVLEIAVQDVAGAVASATLGADRLELCAALAATGGITPSIGLLDAVLAALPAHVGVHALVRPRAGSFTYSVDELAVQVRDVRAAVRAGAAGVVVGALRPDGSVDPDAVARLVEAADGREVTFHRAFDTLDAPARAVDELVALGVARVLTSGGAARSIDGLVRLADTVARSAGRLEIMAGGGVRPDDIPALVGTGVDAVHLSASRHVDESGGPGGGSAGYTTTDPAVVAAAAAALGRHGVLDAVDRLQPS